MQSKRFEELKATGLLPSPTGIGLEILRLTRDENVSAAEIGRVIQADPALTGRTLRLANTGNASSGRQIANVADAVARLGTRTVSAIALGFTVLAGNRSGKCRGFDYTRFWSHSLACAVATQILASHTRHTNAGDGFTAGLLGQIGRLALASIHTEKYAEILAAWNNGRPEALIRLEQAAFITDHNELSAVLLADWGLPKAVCEASQHQENPSASGLEERTAGRDLARIVHAASQIADVCVAPNDRQAAASASELVTCCETVGIDSQALAALFERVFTQWAEWGRLLEIPTQKLPNLAELIEAGRSFEASQPTEAKEPEPVEPMEPGPADSFESSEVDEGPETVPADQTATVAAARESGDGLLVLLADDDPASVAFLERFLVLSGHRVLCASNARQALQLFFESAPPLVIVDAGFPEFGGLELCRRLRQTSAGRQAYVIMLTPPDDEETLARLFEAGVDDFVTKPFAARPLFARIRASLRVVSLQHKVNADRDEIHRVHAELAVAHRRLEQDALTDVLTGLPNRRYLIDRLAHDWAAARRGGTPLACMVVDIDHFKTVNDTFGHDVGDEVLRAVANVLQRHVRGTDVVCRFGGEEFVVISATDFDSAVQFAERLRGAIEHELPNSACPISRPVTVSIGVDVRSPQTRSPEALLKAADEGLFLAKRRGRNCVASTNPKVRQAVPAEENPSVPAHAVDAQR
ncbi:MAG TPA: diguanylate cyclase [Planctomycetaceae bacterium]|jgi:diguanylate cyclase (GGDEF)-like protein|nr:diguanylate cyclase [Planctomycetaceae bacterium]